MSPLLEFHQVTRRFSRSWALRHASFRVPAGSITALLGPNGAGKSTALKIALNLLRPSSGHVEILGGLPGFDWPPAASPRRCQTSADLNGYLCQNIDRMKFDPAMRRWGL
jgi:ABC-type multidrug transport system ATPase subunit